MIHCEKQRSFGLVLLAILVSSMGSISCGVKGMPLPPLEPPRIGRGAPNYRDTAIEAKPEIPPVASPTPAPAQEGRE